MVTPKVNTADCTECHFILDFALVPIMNDGHNLLTTPFRLFSSQTIMLIKFVQIFDLNAYMMRQSAYSKIVFEERVIYIV